MCPLRRVEDRRAGPSALGILVPPGRRHLLILRPRALFWDLLLLRSDSAQAFREMPQNEATALVLALYRALGSGTDPVDECVEEVAGPDGRGFRLSVRVGPFALVVCGRRPGQPYQALTFPSVETAEAASEQLHGILCPPPHIEQEVYLNTRHFTR